MREPPKKQGQKPRNIRHQNRRIILGLYHRNEDLSVAEVSKLAGLSRTTVMKVVQNLLDEGFLVESGKRQINESGGKKPNLFRFNSRRMLIAAIYIQYEKILLRIYDLKYETILDDSEGITRTSDFPEIVSVIRRMIQRSENGHPDLQYADFLACMIGLHGNIDQDTGLCLQAANFQTWGIDRNVRRDFEEQLGLDCPVYIDNWIRFKAFGRSRSAAEKRRGAVLLLDAGWHGAGVGILQNGELYQGKHHVAGEIGHFRVNYEDEEECFCGSRGCFEQQIMPERLHDRARSSSALFPESLLADFPESFTYQDLFKAADAGDPLACGLLDPVIAWFAQIVSYLLLFFDPEILYIEGDYAVACRYFREGLAESLEETALPRIRREGVIQYREGGADSVLLGAAIFAYERYFAEVPAD